MINTLVMFEGKIPPSQENHTDDADEDDDDDGTITPPFGGRHNELSITVTLE